MSHPEILIWRIGFDWIQQITKRQELN
jgi:hypothetical protein